MGKKNKKKNLFDYTDISVEEQKANAEMFNDIEEGEASILDVLNYKVPSAPISQSSFTKQIESACFNMKNVNTDKDDECTESEDSINNQYIDAMISAVSGNSKLIIVDDITDVHDEYVDECTESLDDDDDEEDNEDEEVDEIIDNDKDEYEEEKTDNILLPMIHCRYNLMTGRVIIDDEAIPTTISPIHTATLELNNEIIPTDPDEYNTLISRIFFYIIACKHPSVIVSEETFKIEFSMFANIESDRFIFFKNNGYVYVYILDEDMRDMFFGIKDILRMNDETFIRYIVGAAYASNTMHNTFMYNDEDEVESVMEERHAIKDLIAYIEQNAEVEYAGHNSSAGDVITRLHVFNLEKFVSGVREILEDMITEDEDDDDDYDYEKIEDDDIDEDETDDDIDVNDFPDDDSTVDTDDIDQMFEEIESTENIVASTTVTTTEETTIEKVNVIDSSNNDGSMRMPIIRRR